MLPQNLTLRICLAISFVLWISGCDQAKEEIELTFQVDISGIMEDLKDLTTVGVVGDAPLLHRYDRKIMKVAEKEGRYELTLCVPDSLVGRPMRYAFIVDEHRDNERYGWRNVTLPDHSQQLPIAIFDDKRGSTDDKIEPAPPIPVIFSNTPQEDNVLAQPFRGITTDGELIPGLFPIQETGVSTAPIRDAVQAFLATLTEDQKAACVFPLEDDEWRKWHNIDIYDRAGITIADLDEA